MFVTIYVIEHNVETLLPIIQDFTNASSISLSDKHIDCSSTEKLEEGYHH